MVKKKKKKLKLTWQSDSNLHISAREINILENI